MSQFPVSQRQEGGRLTRPREHPLEQLRREFDTLFGRMWGGWLSPFDQDFSQMRVWDFDVKENDKEFVIRAELPGFEEKELNVEINRDTLTIKAEKEKKGEQEEEFRSFYRTIALPAGVAPDKVQATYRNGVLELHLPRAEEARPRKIEVRSHQEQPGQLEQQAANQTPAAETSPEKGKK